MSKMDEQILVGERAVVFANEGLAFQGLQTDKAVVDQILGNIDASLQVRRRGDMEEDRNFKQPIPYFIIRKGDKIFTYKRLGGSGETRLVDKLSIGVGGHMNKLDNHHSSDIYTELSLNATRELNEELKFIVEGGQRLATVEDMDIVGLINDDLDPKGVGQVHIGILSIIDVDETYDVTVRETDVLEGAWLTLEELLQSDNYDLLESWSQIALDALR